jgi:hypothetical protein
MEVAQSVLQSEEEKVVTRKGEDRAANLDDHVVIKNKIEESKKEKIHINEEVNAVAQSESNDIVSKQKEIHVENKMKELKETTKLTFLKKYTISLFRNIKQEKDHVYSFDVKNNNDSY